MAKAWAHPADVSLLGQTQPTTSGDIDSEGDFLPGMGQRPQVRLDHPPLNSEDVNLNDIGGMSVGCSLLSIVMGLRPLHTL